MNDHETDEEELGETPTEELLERLAAELPSGAPPKAAAPPKPAPAAPKAAAPPKPAPAADPLEELLRRAQKGDESVLPQLRQTLDANPHLWREPGDVARLSEEAWLGMMAGRDRWLKEATRRRLRALREEVAGPSPSPLERLLAERIAATWLQVQHADSLFPLNANRPLAEADRRDLLRRQAAANTAHLQSLMKLALVRKLLKPSPSPLEMLRPVEEKAGGRRDATAPGAAGRPGPEREPRRRRPRRQKRRGRPVTRPPAFAGPGRAGPLTNKLAICAPALPPRRHVRVDRRRSCNPPPATRPDCRDAGGGGVAGTFGRVAECRTPTFRRTAFPLLPLRGLPAADGANTPGNTSACGVDKPPGVFQDFFVDIGPPTALTQNEGLAFPVAVYNYHENPQPVTRALQQEDWFALTDGKGLAHMIGLRPQLNEVTSGKFRVRASRRVRCPGRNG